jgi:6-phosphofructokinase
MPQGKVLVAQGGGPTAVINQSMAGVVLEARKFRNVELVYGAYHGVRGIVEEEFLDLTQETSHNIEMVACTPSSALGSTRDKPDLKYCQEIFKVLKAHGIGYFFYIGGNDSSDTVRIVSEEARRAGYPLRCIHIPKTIDNDLVGNDHTPGFPRRRASWRRPSWVPTSTMRIAGRLSGGGDGPACRVPDSGVGSRQEVPGRRPAPDLSARAHL